LAGPAAALSLKAMGGDPRSLAPHPGAGYRAD